MGVEVNEDYLLGGSIVEVLYIFSWKQAVVLGKAVSESDEDEDDKDFLVWLIGDEVENFSVRDVKVPKTLIRRCTRKVSRLSFLQSLCDQNLLSDQHGSTLEEEEGRKGSLQFLLSLPHAMRTWVWDNEMEIEEKVNLPFESSQEEANFASSSMASCSASTPYVPNVGSVKDIDFESEYYFSDAESVCG